MRIGLALVAAVAIAGCGGDDTVGDALTPQDLSATARDFAGAFDLAQPSDGPAPRGDGGAPLSAMVAVTTANGFRPASVTIAKGGTVTWMIDAGHTVTSGPNRTVDGKFCSGLPTNTQPGLTACAATVASTSATSYSFKFDTAGTYPYFCKPHAIESGTIIVQ